MSGREWIEHAIFWHLYPLGFVGAEPTAPADRAIVHRLRRLTDWLDYAVELGVSGLLLGPIFDSSTHGYDTIDYFRIDSRLGDEADFDRLVADARRRGLRLVLDGVFNHVGRAFPRFQAALENGPDSAEARWFRRSGSGYATFEGHDALVALNHDELAVAQHVVAVMNHWLDRGASGWRLDAAYAVDRHFWSGVVPEVRRRHPGCYIVGEMIHGDYAGFVRETGVDSVTQYELWKAIWSALNDRNLFELAHALDRHNRNLDTFAPLTFVGNHDVTRLASRLHDQRDIAVAVAILMTVGGTPCIYSGDEQAFRGIKENRAGGDDAIRPEFPERPDQLAPCGRDVYRLHQDLIGLRRRHPWLVRARSRVHHLRNREIVFAVESPQGQLIVAINLDDDEASMPLPAGGRVLSGHGQHDDARDPRSMRLHLPAHGWAVLGG